ncbi:MAG: glucose-6-phosphate isomerase [Oscillospiraceae bacterium]|nr:glucose-6-phosphate isomerase [Oscillospiraceae bacterium]
MSIVLNRNLLAGFIEDEEYLEIESAVRQADRGLREATVEGSEYLGWLRLPEMYDRQEFERIQQAADRIRTTSDLLIVIGIGGSYLGARAVIELLGSRYYNEYASLKIYFLGNSISPIEMTKVMGLCEGKRVSLNVVSKSGTTLEPALAFRLLRKMMIERYGREEAAERIYVTADTSRGALKAMATQEHYECFGIPDDVGGRYSVLTAVGLLPIAAAGFDILKLMDGAKAAMLSYDQETEPLNDCLTYAATRYILYKKGKLVELCSCFEPSFTMFGEWFKQLFAESEGKNGKGIFPSSLIYSTDLHSLGQYIQEGERLFFETLIQFKRLPVDITIEPEADDFDQLNYVSGHSMSYIDSKAAEGVLLAHVDGGVPCMIIELSNIGESAVGELIYFFERACAVSGILLGINPFNQPGVENYKLNMFSLLYKPGYEQRSEELRKRMN